MYIIIYIYIYTFIVKKRSIYLRSTHGARPQALRPADYYIIILNNNNNNKTIIINNII